MIPERLNIFELLVRREIVEARGRKDGLRHDPSIPVATRNSVLLVAIELTGLC
jgi:hypothetical protein